MATNQGLCKGHRCSRLIMAVASGSKTFLGGDGSFEWHTSFRHPQTMYEDALDILHTSKENLPQLYRQRIYFHAGSSSKDSQTMMPVSWYLAFLLHGPVSMALSPIWSVSTGSFLLRTSLPLKSWLICLSPIFNIIPL